MQVSEQNQWRVDLWSAIIERLSAQYPQFSRLDPAKQSLQLYYKSHMTLYMDMTAQKNCIYCALWIQGHNKDSYYAHLEAQRSTIEAELKTAGADTQVVWEPKPGQQSASILLKANIDPTDAANREQVIAWFSDNAIPFLNAFQNRIDSLAEFLPDTAPMPEERLE